MEITLQHVRPGFLEEEKINSSDVWTQEHNIGKKDIVQILATSGRGKTSFIHFLYGLRSDYSGEILFDGKSIKLFNAEDWAHYRSSRLSIIFQDLRLFSEQTVRENLLVKQQLNLYENAASIDEMAMQLGIEKKLEKKAHTCSYGEQQRIAIIRALLQPYEMLLLDEPFSHLDEANRKKALDLIMTETAKRNAGMLLADLKKIDYFPATKTLNL
ncbi:MAG: ATP-binding cassette domain-containing protein [Ferruginibacter sp.]